MARMVYATRGWKRLQKEYIENDLYTLRRKKLDELLLRDIAGLSYEEMVIYYTTLSFLSLHCAVSGYMQTGALPQAECWLCLSAQARMTANAVLLRNPRWTPAAVKALPMEDLSAALLCGQTGAVMDSLHVVTTALQRETVPLWNGKPDTRIDQRQTQRRKRRLTSECTLYMGLLEHDDASARQALAELDGLGWDPLSHRALHALMEDDGAGFAEALTLHMKDFRAVPEAGELNHTVLFWESLYQRRGGQPFLDLADAPAALLNLPSCDPAEVGEALHLRLPLLDPEIVLTYVDATKTGPKAVSL